MNRVRQAVIPILIAIAACTADKPGAPMSARSGESVEVDGTVRHVAVEGGCWIIETAQGRMQPVDLPERFRVDGLPVRVKLRDAPDSMSVCQVGTLKHVDEITARQ
jgi:hypothetical protein